MQACKRANPGRGGWVKNCLLARHKAFGPQSGTRQTQCNMPARTSLPSPTNMHETKTCHVHVCSLPSAAQHQESMQAEPFFFVHRVAGVSFASWSAQALPAGSSTLIAQYIKGAYFSLQQPCVTAPLTASGVVEAYLTARRQACKAGQS